MTRWKWQSPIVSLASEIPHIVQEVSINSLKFLQMPPYARESRDDFGHSPSMQEMTAAMLRLHQTGGIEVGFGEGSVKEDLPFGWFKYIEGGMRRRDVNVDSWANWVLTDCLRWQRRGKRRMSVHQ